MEVLNSRRHKILLSEKGVSIYQKTSYTPASNGLIERTQGVLISHVRSCLIQAKFLMRYWADALRHVIQAKKIKRHSTIKMVALKVLFGSDPDYAKHLLPFGCKVIYAAVTTKLPKFGA